MIIRLKMFNPCSTKLGFVKALKDLTRLGLKESKDIADEMWEEQLKRGTTMKEIYLEGSYSDNAYKIAEFKKALNSIAPRVFDVNDTEYERNRKLLSLGVAGEDDYADGIAEILTMLCYNKSVELMEKELKNAFVGTDKTNLERIYNQLSKRLTDVNDKFDTTGMDTFDTI